MESTGLQNNVLHPRKSIIEMVTNLKLNIRLSDFSKDRGRISTEAPSLSHLYYITQVVYTLNNNETRDSEYSQLRSSGDLSRQKTENMMHLSSAEVGKVGALVESRGGNEMAQIQRLNSNIESQCYALLLCLIKHWLP
ncbi:hypothetical protein AVEN_187499-1 [Araneus ventricosus]|uniref:Uncharacterized protein n=1 Tax=Araneus ventricosus TaxID=182803 RepID=A0A4Y2BS14_ARAVE|nr:hypothetical protein AVEN_187499-1 [Araneus ventricosus]